MRLTVNLEDDLYAIARALARAENLLDQRGRLATLDSALAALHADVAEPVVG